MTKSIKQADSLSEAEKQLLFGWGVDIFGADALDLRWRPKDLHFMLEVDRQTVSHVGVLKHDVTVDGMQVTVGGVGGVVTRPEWQKRGYARELMQHTVDFFDRWQVKAGLLFCLARRVPFYEAQGWQLVDHSVIVEQPTGEIESPLEVMIISFGDLPGRRAKSN